MPKRLCLHSNPRFTCSDCKAALRTEKILDETRPPAQRVRKVRTPTRVRADRGPTIQASFDSDCGACFETMYEGDEICAVDGAWMHAECADE